MNSTAVKKDSQPFRCNRWSGFGPHAKVLIRPTILSGREAIGKGQYLDINKA